MEDAVARFLDQRYRRGMSFIVLTLGLGVTFPLGSQRGIGWGLDVGTRMGSTLPGWELGPFWRHRWGPGQGWTLGIEAGVTDDTTVGLFGAGGEVGIGRGAGRIHPMVGLAARVSEPWVVSPYSEVRVAFVGRDAGLDVAVGVVGMPFFGVGD